jgi:alkaline phosphatase
MFSRQFTLTLISVLTVAAILLVPSLWRVAFPSLTAEAGLPPSPYQTPVPTQTPTPTATLEPTPAVLVGAGDISLCGWDTDDHTAALIQRVIARYPHAQVFTAGDNVQVMGETYEYTGCFHPAWGRFKNRIHPSPGNHDWYTDQGGPYFLYFGTAAGPAGLGYYSYDLGTWHIVSLNSNCDSVGCGEDSAQAQWLRADLQQSGSRCTLLYWHHTLRSSGTVPLTPAVSTFWEIAAEHGAEVVVNGHDHHYERFALLDRDGNRVEAGGIRSFIVGTGGAWLFDLDRPLPETEVRDNATRGVMLFRLFPGYYEWEFLPADGGLFSDAGSGVCF